MNPQEIIEIDDRGTAEYFHGRKPEIDFFKASIERCKKTGKAKSILIQGPPGVGKTALKNQLKQITKDTWQVIELDTITDLADPVKLGNSLLGRKKFQKTAKEIGLDLKAIKGKIIYEKTNDTVSEILSLLDKPTLLVLDEAQMAEIQLKKDTELWRQVSSTLNNIHNLENGYGWITLFAGLGNTRKIYHDFRISRFYANSVIDLGPIDETSETNIIKDYLVRGAEVNPKHLDLDHWIHQLSKQTYQWPHHIVSYGETASKMIRNNKGILSDKVLNETLQKGLFLKNDYYEHRFYEINPGHRCSIYHGILENEISANVINVDKVLDDFTSRPYIEDPQKTWDNLIGRGIVQIGKNGFYQIPIPSMRTWMIKQCQMYHQLMQSKPSLKMQQIFKSLDASKIDKGIQSMNKTNVTLH
ncbi:MAG: ATP-binding protein [Flavobacteriaceae bacterium]|nr:ATP-binding protein [Flavobacteriaceae bacterium]